MVEYIGESRIDGYPIVKITTDSDGQLFLDYFRNIPDDKYLHPVELQYVNQLIESDKFTIIKITLDPKKFKKELSFWKKDVRIQKLKQIDENK